MEQIVLLVIALGALSCITANTAMAMKLLFPGKGKARGSQETEKTMEELERERKQLEQQRLELEGLENQLRYTGFLWKDGGSQ